MTPVCVTDKPPAETLLAESSWLLGLARDLVDDPHAADDLVQDTMLVALRHHREARKLRPWLSSVLRNLAHRQRRRDSQRADIEKASINLP